VEERKSVQLLRRGNARLQRIREEASAGQVIKGEKDALGNREDILCMNRGKRPLSCPAKHENAYWIGKQSGRRTLDAPDWKRNP